jgi:triacylglycerol lipase
MKLSELFERCCSIDYQQVGEAADFAIERQGQEAYLYFQQSRGCIDWENNLDFPAKAHGRAMGECWYAHRGFLRVWQSAEPYLAPILADRSIRRLTVAGYSHGAALAVFCHEYAWYHRPDLREDLAGFGFGCPRVVWGRLPKVVAERWRDFTVIRNINDMVTRLPPALMGYHHVGTLLEIGVKGRYSDWDAHRKENILKELQRME